MANIRLVVRAALLSLIAWSYGTNVWAGHPDCRDELVGMLRTVDPKLTAAERDEVLQSIRSVDSFLGKLRPARSFVIDIQKRGSTAAYADVIDNPEIRLVHQYEVDGKTKNPIFTRAVTSHEYGHALLAENLPEYSNEGKRILHGIRDSKVEAKEAEAKLSAVEAEFMKSVTGTPESDALSKKMREIGQGELVPAKQKGLNLLVDRVKLGYFDEFFGDFTAALATEDPRAAARVLEAGGATRSKLHRSRLRDFSGRETWKSVHEVDDYTMSTPLRKHMWERYLSRPSIMKKKDVLMEGMMKAMGGTFDAMMARDGGAITTMDQVRELNDDAIRRVDEILAPIFPE